MLTRQLILIAALATPASAQTPPSPVGELDLEELSRVEVTSASRRPESLSDAPASIYVITAEDIQRSGVTTVAEALRLAPNLQVARSDATQYSMTARGFNGAVANKLLVQIDGRTIYTPLFSGVFWDQQDLLMEDIERIEVMSGPGATLWGANAVNGVINVITRSSRDTHGIMVTADAGNTQQGIGFRYGSALGAKGHVRVYGKATNIEATWRNDVFKGLDARRWFQTGARADWTTPDTSVTLQGDAYQVVSDDHGTFSGLALGRTDLRGANVLGAWTRRFGAAGEFRVQTYFDHAQREERVLFQPTSNLFDVEAQHSFDLGEHGLVVGGGYRHGSDDVADGILVGFRPRTSHQSWGNAYAQDRIRVTENVDVTAGIRFDRNPYTGWEYEPDARIGWKPADGQLLWGSVSRAVRAPARFDRDVTIPPGIIVFGGPNFVSEVANVFQVGYRGRTANVVSWSVTAFRHNWDRLRSGTSIPVFIENRIEGPAYGVEGWGTWQVLSSWRLSVGASSLRKDLRLEPGSTDPVGVTNSSLANDPDGQLMVRSALSPWATHEFDVIVRRVGALPHPIVPAYTAVDMRYALPVRGGVELSIVGQNLFDRRHPEFNDASSRYEIERSVLVQARWRR